jgi:hypothetical protein
VPVPFGAWRFKSSQPHHAVIRTKLLLGAHESVSDGLYGRPIPPQTLARAPVNRAGVALVLVTASFAVAGCGSSGSGSSSSSSSGSSSATTAGSGSTTASVGHLPTAKFVLHAGLAFGAFHHYIYKPFRAGALTGGGLFKHKLALLKAGLAGLFAYHELKLALADAKASPILSKLLSPVNALAAKLAALGSGLKSGHVDSSSLGSANAGVSGVVSQARQNGVSISDQVPGSAALAAG